jgi:hypothetical protein
MRSVQSIDIECIWSNNYIICSLFFRSFFFLYKFVDNIYNRACVDCRQAALVRSTDSHDVPLITFDRFQFHFQLESGSNNQFC